MTQQLRLALINNGPEYTYATMKLNSVDEAGTLPPRRTMYTVKNEFEFGMSNEERNNLFRTIRHDILVGHSTNQYSAESFTNPNAINSLRQQAVNWSKIPNNCVPRAYTDDAGIREFFRELAANVPEEDRRAAMALIDQPAEYRQPLPGTISAGLRSLPISQTLQGDVSNSASNRAPLGVQAQQNVYLSNANASSYSAALSTPLTAGKRSYSAISSDPTSHSNPAPTFKRARPAYESQAFASSGSYNPQSSSFSAISNGMGQSPAHAEPSSWSASNGMSRPNVQQQLPLPPASNAGVTNYQPHLFQDASFDPPQPQSQSQPSSSWSASNGMSRSILQQQLLPQITQAYNSGTTNYNTNVFQGGQYFNHSQFQPSSFAQESNSSGNQNSQPTSSLAASNQMSQSTLQQQLQLQMPSTYNSGTMNYQPNVFQGGQFFDPLQIQPGPYTQPSTYPGPQTFQASLFSQGNVSQGPATNMPSMVGQPYNASASFNLVATQDDEWAQLMRTIDTLAPIVPTTSTPSAPTLPLTTANNQAPPVSFNPMLAQQPGTTG